MLSNKDNITITISKSSVINIAVTGMIILIIVSIASKISDVLFIILLSYILTIALRPAQKKLSEWKVNTKISVILTHLIFVLLVIGGVSLIVVPISMEINTILSDLDRYVNEFLKKYDLINKLADRFGFTVGTLSLKDTLNQYFKGPEVSSTIGDILAQGYGIANSIASLLWNIFLIVMCSLYFSFIYDDIIIFILKLISNIKERERVNRVIKLINEKLGYWMQGQIILSVLIFLISLILLTILKIPLAFPLALLAGLLEIIPNIGPIIAWVFAFIVALAVGTPYQYIGVSVGYFIIQMLENYLLVPRIMSKSVNIQPFFILLAVLIGGKLAGPLGALISIPLMVVIIIIIENYYIKKD